MAHAFRAHVRHVDARCQSAERVVRADVGRRFLAADVLLARGEGEHEPAPALGVVRCADQTAGQTAHEIFPAGDEADVWTAIAWAEAELLAFADSDVSAVLAGRSQKREADGINAGNRDRADVVRP